MSYTEELRVLNALCKFYNPACPNTFFFIETIQMSPEEYEPFKDFYTKECFIYVEDDEELHCPMHLVERRYFNGKLKELMFEDVNELTLYDNQENTQDGIVLAGNKLTWTRGNIGYNDSGTGLSGMEILRFSQALWKSFYQQTLSFDLVEYNAYDCHLTLVVDIQNTD